MGLNRAHRPLISRAWAETMEANLSRLGRSRPAPFAEYNGDPCRFDREVLGNDSELTEYWGKQVEIVNDLEKHRRVLVASCNGSGKSTLISRVIPYFMTTRINARVRVTAGTGSQVMNVHRKVRAVHQTSKLALPGEVGKQYSWELGPEWLYDGISADAEETMQGLHSTGLVDEPGADGGLLAIIDEASGAEDFKFKAMRGYMTTENTYWLIVGNPNKPDGQFKEMWEQAPATWKRHQISAYDVPDHILAPSWIEEEIAYWGEDSPQCQVRVFGQFPSGGGDYSVFPLSDLSGAADVHPEDGSGLHLGVDIARGDGDLNTLCLAENGRVTQLKGWHSRDLMQVVQVVIEWIERHSIPARHVHVDVIGLGAGVVDRLRERGYHVEGVDFGNAPKGDWSKAIGRGVKVKNRRAELYWAARCQLRNGKASVPEKFRREIWAEASRIQYLPKDVIQIEPKEKIRARLDGKSPDFTDAWVLTFSRAGNKRALFVG